MTLLHLVPGEKLDTFYHRGWRVDLYADTIHDQIRHTGDKVGYKITDPEGIPVEAANGLHTRRDAQDPEGWIRQMITTTIDLFIEHPEDRGL